MGGILGLKPQSADEFKRDPSEPESFYPSRFSLWYGTPCMKGFKELDVQKQYDGEKRILVVCTSKHLLSCANNKFFNTGHHSTEMFVPMYHLEKCGFKFDIATPDGGKVAVEEWSYRVATDWEPKLRDMALKVKEQIETPMKLADVGLDLESYAAIFLPGGHAPLIDLANNEHLGSLLRSAHEKEITTIAICHGPAGLRSAAVGGEFPYNGYKIVVFPDSMDEQSPTFGYLPGKLNNDDKAEFNLKSLGCLVQNKAMDASTCVDRELITGCSPAASQELSKIVVGILADKCGFTVVC